MLAMPHNLRSEVDNRHRVGDSFSLSYEAAATLSKLFHDPAASFSQSPRHPNRVRSRQLTRLLDLGRLADRQKRLDRLFQECVKARCVEVFGAVADDRDLLKRADLGDL